MSSGEKPISISTATSFSEVVDETCERLRDKHVQCSIRRIHEMEDILNGLEQELDQFLFSRDRAPRSSGISGHRVRDARFSVGK